MPPNSLKRRHVCPTPKHSQCRRPSPRQSAVTPERSHRFRSHTSLPPPMKWRGPTGVVSPAPPTVPNDTSARATSIEAIASTVSTHGSRHQPDSTSTQLFGANRGFARRDVPAPKRDLTTMRIRSAPHRRRRSISGHVSLHNRLSPPQRRRTRFRSADRHASAATMPA